MFSSEALSRDRVTQDGDIERSRRVATPRAEAAACSQKPATARTDRPTRFRRRLHHKHGGRRTGDLVGKIPFDTIRRHHDGCLTIEAEFFQILYILRDDGQSSDALIEARALPVYRIPITAQRVQATLGTRCASPAAAARPYARPSKPSRRHAVILSMIQNPWPRRPSLERTSCRSVG